MISSKREGFPTRMVALVTAVSTLALAAVTFGGAFIPWAQAQNADRAISAPTLTSDTSGTFVA